MLVFGQTPVARYGKLKLNGIQLSSECGNPVQLKGMSSHGPQYTLNCLEDPNAYITFQKDWGADIFRILKNNPSGLVGEEFESGLAILPNPSLEVINVKNSQVEINGAVVQLIDNFGTSVMKFTCLSNDNQINIGNLKPNIYMVKMTRNNKIT